MCSFVNVSILLFFIVIFVSLISTTTKPFVRRINLKMILHPKVMFSKNAHVFLPLLSSYSNNLCVICENNDMLVLFTKALVTNNIFKTLTIQELSEPIMDSCESTVFLEVNVTEMCEDINLRYSRGKFVFIILNTLDTSELLQCLSTFQLVTLDLVSVNLQEGTLHKFSPTSLKFEQTIPKFSIREAYNRTNKHDGQDKIPNLGNITVNIAAVVFPPLEIFEDHGNYDIPYC